MDITTKLQAKIYMVDAFTKHPLEGNPCSVIVSNILINQELRIRLAKQTNNVVTCFISPKKETDVFSYDIHYLTPVDQLEICGHATLAATKVLYSQNIVPKDQPIDFYYTQTQKIQAKYINEQDVSINMPQLLLSPLCKQKESQLLADICSGLEIGHQDIIYFGKNQYDYVVQVSDEEIVRKCTPNIPKLTLVKTRAVILTATGNQNHDFDTITRVFLPLVGINEDNVCGSAHCGIAKHYSDLLGKTQLMCWEPSQRPGSLKITILEEGRLDIQAPCHLTFGGADLHF